MNRPTLDLGSEGASAVAAPARRLSGLRRLAAELTPEALRALAMPARPRDVSPESAAEIAAATESAADEAGPGREEG